MGGVLRSLYDYDVISDDGTEVPTSLGKVADGESVLRRERLFRALGETGFEREEAQIGVLYLEERRSVETGEVVCRAVFRFDEDQDSLTASGVLPEVSGESGAEVGSGRLGIVGGSGKFKHSRGQAIVEVMNPKRWSADDTP